MRGTRWWLLGLGVTWGAAIGFLVVNLGLAQLQADHAADSFRPGSDLEVQLDTGDQRTIYLGPQESEVLGFDWYPSDLTCAATAPGGDAEPIELTDDRRLVDGQRSHWAVGRFESTTSGVHVVRCDDRSGRTAATLLLARPPRYVVGWADPTFGWFVLFATTGLCLAVGAVLGALALDRRARRDRPSPPLADPSDREPWRSATGPRG